MAVVHDLESFDLQDLQWNDVPSSLKSVEVLYDVVHKKAVSANAWYLEKRKRRKWIAQWLRGLAAIFAAGGFLPPVLQLVEPSIPSDLGYVLFVASGSCLLLNSALGISSGWIRYVTTAFALTSAIEEFQLEWARALAGMSGKAATAEDVQELLTMLQLFVQKINAMVKNETVGWATQFNEDLTQLESIVQKRTQPGR